MRRATITLPDELEIEVETYLAEQEAPPSLNALVQAALRRFLGERRSHREDRKSYARSARWHPEPSEIAEEPGVYELGGTPAGGVSAGWPAPAGGAPWSLAVPARLRLEDLPALLASLPRLSKSEAEELAEDLDRAREELAGAELTDPWARAPAHDGSADGGG